MSLDRETESTTDDVVAAAASRPRWRGGDRIGSGRRRRSRVVVTPRAEGRAMTGGCSAHPVASYPVLRASHARSPLTSIDFEFPPPTPTVTSAATFPCSRVRRRHPRGRVVALFAPGGTLEPASSSNRVDWQPRTAITAPLPDPGEVDVPPRDIHACGPRRPLPPRGAPLSWTHDPAAALVPADAPRSPDCGPPGRGLFATFSAAAGHAKLEKATRSHCD